MGQSVVSLARSSPRVLSERAKKIGRTLSGGLASKSPRQFTRLEGASSSSASPGNYQTVAPKEGIPQLTWCMQRHALITWVFLPSCVVAQAVIPKLRPTADAGYSNVALLVVLLVEAHHVYSEMEAWQLATGLLLRPEWTVMRQLQVFGARWYMVCLGVIEAIDLYSDLVFPLLASICEPDVTKHWKKAWTVTPLVGPALAKVVSIIRFWRVAAFFVVAMVLVGIFFLVSLILEEHPPTPRDSQDREVPRVRADEFLQLARVANAAMMPSVAYLCEEMVDQRRWVFDSSKDSALRMQSLEKLEYGWADTQTAERHEIMNLEEEEKQIEEKKAYFTFFLLMKVVLGNCLQLWLQGSFFALSWPIVGTQAKAKVMLSIFLSSVIAFVRCHASVSHLGCLGFIIIFFIVLFAAWTGLRIFHTFVCEDHLWNLTTGCVTRGP